MENKQFAEDTKMKTFSQKNVMEVAQSVASAASVGVDTGFAVEYHKGANIHRAVRVHGCPINEAHEHCQAVADAISREIKTREGYPAVRVQGGDALVWVA